MGGEIGSGDIVVGGRWVLVGSGCGWGGTWGGWGHGDMGVDEDMGTWGHGDMGVDGDIVA